MAKDRSARDEQRVERLLAESQELLTQLRAMADQLGEFSDALALRIEVAPNA